MIIHNKKSLMLVLLVTLIIFAVTSCTATTNTSATETILELVNDDPIDVQTPNLEVRALSIRHDGYALPIGADGLEFTIRVDDETTLLALLEPLGVIDEITWVIDDVNILEITYTDLDTTEVTIKAISSGTTKLTVIVADIKEIITVRVIDPNYNSLSEPEPIGPIRYRIITEQPTDDFYIMFFITLNGQQPLYIVFEEDFSIEFTSLFDEELSTDVISLDKSLNVEGIPLGFIMVYNNIQWEVWNNGKLVTYDPNQALYVSHDAPELVALLQELMDYIGNKRFDSGMIRNIVSAEIKKLNPEIDGFYGVIITDTNKLADIEAVFKNIIYEASGCPFNDVLLLLTTSTGDGIPLAMASDSCNVFFFNGQYFKFKVPGNVFWYEYFTDHLTYH